MPITVQFYRNKSENIQVNKSLTHVIDDNVIFKDDVDILRPFVIMDRKINCNYAYISDFGRYYYVTQTNLKGGLYRYDFTVDVLMSYKNDIKNTTCTVKRNEFYKNCNGYLADSKYVSLAYKQYVTKLFPSGLHSDSLILNTLG